MWIQNDHFGDTLSSTLSVDLKVRLLVHGYTIGHQTRTSGSHLGGVSCVTENVDREGTLGDITSRVLDHNLMFTLCLGNVGHGVGQVLVVVEATVRLLLLSTWTDDHDLDDSLSR